MLPRGAQMVRSSRFLFLPPTLIRSGNFMALLCFSVPGHQDRSNDTPTLTLAPRGQVFGPCLLCTVTEAEVVHFQAYFCFLCKRYQVLTPKI